MADTDKIQQTENLVESKKANAERVYNEASNAEQGYDFEQRMAEMRARVQKSSQAQPQRTETVTQPKAETPPTQPVAHGQQPQQQPQPQQQQPVEQVETVTPNAVAHEDKSGSKFYNYNIPAEDIESDIAELQRLNKGGVDYVEGKGTYEFWPSGSAKGSTAPPLWNSVVDNLYEMGKDMHRYPGVRSITTPEGTRYTFGLDGERTGVEYREDYSLVKPRFVGSRANELEVDENLQGRIGLPIPQKYDTAVSRAYQSGKWKTLEGDVTDYSGYSDAQLREEYNRLMSGASGLDDNKAALEAGNVYDELVSHSIGFSNAKEMNSNKGTRDLRLMGERINSTYPSEIYSSYLQQALQTGQVGDVPDVFQLIDGMVGDQLSGDLDNMGESEVAPIRRINDALKNEMFMKHYPTWALLNAAKKNISYEQSWNEGIETFADKWQSRVSDLKQEISSNMEQEAESFSSDHPIMYTAVSAVDKSIIAKLIVSGANIIERSADPTAAKRQRYYDTFVSQADMNAGYQVILPMATGMFIDTPAFGVGGKVANWGTVKLVGKEMLGSELANTTSSMINLGLFGLAGQASDDIYRRQFSGWNYATGLGKSILSGGVLAKMGAVTRRGLFSAATKGGRFGNDTYRFLGEYLGFAGTDIVVGIASGEVRHMSDVYKILAESGATLGAIKAAHIGQGQSYEKGESAAKALEGKYGNLAKAVRENNNKASRGETILSLRDEDALRDWVRLNQDLLNGTAGVTWEDVKSVSALIGEECSTPIPSSTRMVKDNGAVRVQVLDGAGNVIRERSFSEKKAKKAETFQGECDELISWAAERDNESRYVMGLASENVYNVARDIAESRNEGNEVSPTLPDGTPNPDFFCTIPETVVEEYYTAKNTPEEKRTAEQQRFVEEFDKALAEVGDPALEPGSVRTKVCEQFGITEEQFKEQWEKSPKERDRKSKAAQAIIAYNKIMAGGHVLRRGKPIGEAVLDDGSTIRVINKVDVAEQLPADESAMIMYLAEDGTVQAVSAKRVTKIEYEENPIEAAQDERYKLSSENAQRVIDELRENVSNMIKDFSVEDLEAELKALNEEAQSNPDVASRNRLIAAIVEDALEKKRNGQDQQPQEESADVVIDGEGNVVETEQPGTGTQEQTGRLVIDDSKYNEGDVMTREELQAGADFLNGEMDAREFAHRIGWDDEYISGFSEEELKNTARTIAEGMREYLKVEEPKKEETPPVVQAGTEPEGIVVDGNGAVVESAPAASKETPSRDERVEKLLDAMGFEKKEERDEQRAFYADKNNEEQFEKDYSAFVGKKTETVDDSQQEVKAVDPLDEPMPKDDKGKVVMRKASTRRTRKYLYEDLGLSKEDADSIVDYELEKATKAQEDYAQKKKRPTIKDKGIDGDPEKLKQKLDEYEKAAQAAQDDVRYWEEVKRMVEEPAEPESVSTPEPSTQNAGAANTVGSEVKEKWNNASKVYGKSDTMRLENGTKLNGRYVLAPSGSASASHDANNNYNQTPGFPVDSNGNTANSRDYRGNASYRQTTERHGESYNENAIQDRVVVSKDGVVLSGNGRTMAGELAARHNTDKEYIDYLREHAEDFGFTKEQVDSMEHPRVLFEVQEDLPYTAETFDMFNKGKEKVENKTESAVRLGKTTPAETISKVLEIIDQFDNIGDFNNNNQAPIDVLRELASAGVITQNEINALMENGKLSPQGKDFIENLLVGNIFASVPDAVRILSNNADVRQKVVTGLSALTSNARLGGGYSLVDEITTAIKLIANEREGNLERGSTMQAITTSLDFGADFGSTPTEAFTNQLVIMLTEMLNGKRVREFKEFLDSYNNEAEVSAGGETRMFGNLGTKEEIFNFIIDNFKNGRYKKSRDARAGAGQGEGERAGDEETGPGAQNPRADEGQEVGGEDGTRFRDGEGDAGVAEPEDGNAPTFYSNAARAVEGIKQNKATAEQWLAMIKKNGGLKSGEDKWMGLSQWLEDNKGKSLTKEEVQQFIADNGIEMEEVNYVEHPSQETNETNFFLFTTRLTDELIDLTKTKGLNPEEAFTDLVDKYGTEMLDYVHLEDPGLVRPNKYIDEKDALEYFNQKVNENEIIPIDSTRLNYTTKGLDNKREIAFKVPNIEPYQEHDEVHFGPENQGKAVMWVRFGETTDADGKRVLVIDEIQSNRHQDAREKGYRDHTAKERYEQAQKAYLDYGNALAEKYNVPLNWAFTSANEAEKKQLRSLLEAQQEAQRAYKESYGVYSTAVPAAPFEKNWHEVAMKRMLRLAAEESFDKVAWTTGEQQAERYSLGRMYDSIEREDNPSIDGKRFVLSGRNMDTFLVNKEGNIEDSSFSEFNGKPLSDVVGKELAERMMNLEDGDIIEGEQLNIGGEGMKGFYDKMLPRFMDKYGKRWGVKTGEVQLATPGKEVMHSVDVTPEMKESVMQGQPLFRQQEPMGERGVKKVTVVNEPEYREGTDYFGRPMTHRVRPGQYKVEGYDDIFNSVEEVADFMRKKNPDYCVYIDEDGNIGYEAWSNILPEGMKPNTYAKILASNGGKLSSAMKKRIERYTQREMKQARVRAEEITKELGLDVEFHDDPSEFSGRKSRAKGWYDPKTGKIHIVMGNHSGVSDVMATMLHEGVAHHGLRKLFGEDFDTFLDNVHNNVSEDIRTDINDRIEKMRAADQEGAHSDEYYRRAATEEYLADLAEDGLYNGEQNTGYASRAWQWIKENFINMLRKAGINIELSDDELRYILWSSHKNLRRGAEAMAKDAIMREKAGIKEYVEDGEPVSKVAESGRQMSLFPEGNTRSLGGAREMRDADLLEEISKDRYDVRSAYTDEYDRRHNREYNENYDSTTRMLEDDNTSIEQVEEMLIDAAYYLRNNYTSKERAVAKARFDAIQDYYFSKEAELEKARDDFFLEHKDELKERFGDYYDEEENIDKLMSEYGLARESRVPYGAVSEAREILRGNDIRFRDGEEGGRDYAAEMRELMRRRLRGEDVTAELEQLRAERRAAEAARSTESNGAGNGEPPVEPPTSPAPASPEPAPELPPTGYDRPMSPIEMAQEAAIKVVADTKASLEQRNTARRELDASLKNLHKAMRLQKEYDRTTVENVVSLCKMMVQSGLIDRRYISNLTPLFTKLKDATGKEDLTSTVNGIMDVMLKSQERSIRNELNTLLNTKAQKVNQSGVVTQGGVDIRGQRTLESLNKNFGSSVEGIDREIQRLEELRGRIPENSEERLNEVDDKIQGALLAKQYAETAKNHEDNIRAAVEELDEIKAQYKDGELGIKEYTEQKRALETQIRSYRMSHADAMWDYVNTLRGVVEEGRSRAKDFIEGQKAHRNEIRHNAYSDMLGKSQYTQARPGALSKFANSAISKAVSSSLYTLDTMLRQLGRKHANGEGYLYERFFRGWLDARDREITDYWADRDTLNAKVNELFGPKRVMGVNRDRTFAGLIDDIRKMEKMELKYKDDGDLVSHEMDQAQLMYVYMVNKMEDGVVKLRRMGISEEDVEKIKNFLDPKLVELADWLQNDFLPSKREGYNEVHRRMFGADMDMVENYVPLRIDKGALVEKVDINNAQSEPSVASTVTGGIIKRTHNTTALDLMNTNAIDMILGHLDEMNHWKHFAEWSRDVNSLLSDKTFRNKVKNTTTIYGSGEQLWKRLKDVFFIAGGTYKPQGGDFDKAIVGIAKNVSAAKVSMRIFTATKQLLSLPVFAANCNVGYMLKNMARPAGSWNWCMENLPSFKDRWKSRIAGDTRLEDTDIDWRYNQKKWVQKASRWGLTPNAFVDAMTVAVGARSVYEQRYKRYRKDGYDDVAADRRARQDATIAFNQSQQSSEKGFVAPMQVDRGLAAVGASVFRNASMGYERQLVESVRNLKHLMGKEYMTDEDGNTVRVSYKKASIEFMKKQMMRNGLTETQAERAANRIYKRSVVRNLLKMGMFAFGAQMAWNLGGKLPYMVAQGYNAVFGDDDERSQAGANAWDTTKEAMLHAAIGGWLEGLPFGNIVSDGMNNELNGENFFKFSPDLLPIFGDIEDVSNHFDGKNKLRGVTDLLNLGGQIFIGVNPQTFTDIITGITDACFDADKKDEMSFGTAKEVLLLTMRIMQCPQSQLDQLYIDELRMTARQAQGLTPEQLARRYAYFKAHREAPALWWTYDKEKEDELIKDYEKNFFTKLNKDVKEAGGTSDDYFELMNTSETNKRHDDYKNKAIADLVAKKDLPGIMAAWEKETDWNVKESLMKAYQKLKYGKEQMPSKADEAYEAKNGEDLKKKAEKIGRDLGFEAQDSFFQMSKVKTENKADKNQVVKDFRAAGGKFKYSKDGEYYDINDYEIDYPKKDKAKQAKCLSVVNAHRDELKRIYRNGWRYSRIDFLYKQIEAEGLKKAGGEEYDRDKMVEGFKEIINILNDEMQDIHEKKK